MPPEAAEIEAPVRRRAPPAVSAPSRRPERTGRRAEGRAPGGDGDGAGRPLFEEAFAAEPLAVRAALGRLDAALRAVAVPASARGDVELAVAEALNNVVEHAFPDGRPGRVALRAELRGARLALELRDAGVPLPGGHAALAHGMGSEGTGAAREGGFGWLILRQVAADLRYRRRRGANLLRFRVDLGAPPPPPGGRR